MELMAVGIADAGEFLKLFCEAKANVALFRSVCDLFDLHDLLDLRD